MGTRHQPHCERSCELALRAVRAARGRLGGAPLAWMWGVRGRALSHPRTPVLWGVRPGPTTHWLWVRGVRAWGPVTNPTARALASCLCAPWGRQEGARGGASCLGVGPPRSGALPPPTARHLGREAAAHYPLAVDAGGAGVGTRHQPHSARSSELALRAVGAARGHPGGAPHAWVWVVRGWALSHPRPPVLPGVRPEPTTHWQWVRGVRAWGPVTNPTARALASWLCTPWGRHEGTRGGRLLPGCGASRVRRSPTPGRRSFGACGRGPLPTGCGCRGCGRGRPSPTPQRALWRAGFAHCRGGTRAPGGGGGASCLGVGRPASSALPRPTAHLLRRAAGAHYPLAVGAGGAGVGTRHQPHSSRSCELALRAVGAARGRPGGAPLAWVWGVRGQALAQPRPPGLWTLRPGPTTHWPWVRGVRASGPVTNPSARFCQLALRAVGAAPGRPGGGASCLGVGRPESGALHPPTARPLERAPGAHYPLAVGAGLLA